MKALQKLIGLLLIVVNIIVAYAVSDGTAAVALIPMGLYLSFTRDIVLTIPTYKGTHVNRKKEMTARITSVGADIEQSSSIINTKYYYI